MEKLFIWHFGRYCMEAKDAGIVGKQVLRLAGLVVLAVFDLSLVKVEVGCCRSSPFTGALVVAKSQNTMMPYRKKARPLCQSFQ